MSHHAKYWTDLAGVPVREFVEHLVEHAYLLKHKHNVGRHYSAATAYCLSVAATAAMSHEYISA